MSNPMDYCPDDTICANCERPLPEDVQEGTLAWDGFCSIACQQRNARGVWGRDDYDIATMAVDEAGQSYGEIEGQHRSETAAFGDSWPGAQFDIARAHDYWVAAKAKLAEMDRDIGEIFWGGLDPHPKTTTPEPRLSAEDQALLDEDIPF